MTRDIFRFFFLSNVISNMWYIQSAGIGKLMSVHTNLYQVKVWTCDDRNFTLQHLVRQYFFPPLCAFDAMIQLSLTYFYEHWHIHYSISLMLAA
jgi:hypothetical protein